MLIESRRLLIPREIAHPSDFQAVLIVERWLWGRLRQRTFYSLAEINAALAERMRHLNEERPIRRLGDRLQDGLVPASSRRP
jgi:hypothetical protein